MDFSRLNLNSAALHPIDMRFATYTPLPEDIAILERAFDRKAERKENANKLAAAMQLSLNDLDLNPAEDAWRQDFVNKYTTPIQTLLDDGSFADAAELSLRLGTAAKTDPALRGRIRAQQEYKRKRDEVLARNDLNQVTKDRWIEENPYSYEDKFDERGNVIGGSEWKPGWNPVTRYDMTKIYGLAKELAAREAGGGESATFVDEQGREVTDPSKGFYGMAVKRGTKWERLSEQKLKNVFNSLFKQALEAMDSLMQDMDDRLWQYGKANNEGKKAFIGSDIMDSKGRLYTPEEYLANRVNPVLHEMSYNHRWSSIDYGQGYSNFAKAQEKARLEAQLQGSDNPTTLTKAIEIDMSERAGTAGANMHSAMTQLNSLFPRATKSASYLKAISDGDYNKAANILEGSITSKDPMIRQAARNYINIFKTESEIYNNLTAGFTKEEREALDYVNSREQGADIPDASNNRFSRDYAEHFNKLFGVNQSSGPQSIARGMSNTQSPTWIRPADKIAIVFRSDAQKEAVLRSLGDRSKLATSGITVSKLNGEDCLIVNRNTNRLEDIGKAFAEHGHRLLGFSNTEIYRLDRNNNIMSFKLPGGGSRQSAPISGRKAINVLSYFSPYSSTVSRAKTIVENAFNKKSVQKLIEPIQIRPFDGHNTLILREMRDKGYITNEDYNNRIKEYNDNNMREVLAAAQDLNNFKVWGAFSDEPGNAVRLSQEDVREYQQAILEAYGDDGKGIEIYPGMEPTGKGYGTTIIIKPKAGSNKSAERKGRIIYVDGLLATKAAESMANTPGALNRREYKVNKVANPTVNDIYGKSIMFDDNESNYKRFNATKRLDEIYNGLSLAKQNGEILTKEQATSLAEELVKSSGNVVGSFKASVDIISQKLLDYYKKL